MIASLITALHLFGVISVESAVTSLFIAGVLLIIAELAVISFGLVALNGLLALYAAYTLKTGNDAIFGVTVDWPVLFGIAFVEVMIIVIIVSVFAWLRNQKNTIGKEAMIGEKASIIDWSGQKGNVRFEGEIWKAHSDDVMELNQGEDVIIEAINKLSLKISV